MNNNLAIYQDGKDNKKPIIFIHGFPFDHFTWYKQVNFLKSTYHCITYDIRGLGESPAGNGQFTMELFVDDLFSIINDLNLEKPVICGLSMGGYIALRAVEREQGKFGGIILCDTKSEADSNEGKLGRAAAIKNVDKNGARGFVEGFIPKCFTEKFITLNKKEYEEILDRYITSDPVGIKGCLLAMAGRTDTTNFLPKINIPALLICGGEDRITPPDVMMAMAGKIPGSKFLIIPEAAHLSTFENEKPVNLSISDFLDNINGV